jgi:HSP20 family molecular chaperone IbpA
MDLKNYDPYRAIGTTSADAKLAARSRQERDDAWRPVMDAFHTVDDMVLRYELAGVAPDDIRVRVDGRVLWVEGERRAPDAVAPELSMRAERTYGRFDGSIALPQGTDPAAVRASYQHGVLEIRVGHVRRPDPLDIEPDLGDPDATTIEVRGA